MLKSKIEGYNLLFKYLWVLVILPKTMQFALLVCYTVYLLYKNSFKVKFDTFSTMIMMYAVLHVVSILVNSLYSTSLYRIVAGINTALIWIVADGIYIAFSNANISINGISRYCFINSIVLLFLLMAARIMRGMGMLQFMIPYLNNTLYWQEGYYSRFSGFLEYPTLVVPFTILMLPGTLNYVHGFFLKRFGKKFSHIATGIWYCICCLPVYFCYSRMGYVLLLLGGLCVIAIETKPRITSDSWKLLMVCIFICIGATAIYLKFDTAIIDKLLNMRAGSNSTRLTIYKESLEAFALKPIIGCGIKEISSTGLPLGSHSSYIGFLYKTGIVGTAVILTGFAKKIRELLVNIRTGLNSEKINTFFLLLIFAFALLEDIDGADWLVCLFFALLGIAKGMDSYNS